MLLCVVVEEYADGKNWEDDAAMIPTINLFRWCAGRLVMVEELVVTTRNLTGYHMVLRHLTISARVSTFWWRQPKLLSYHTMSYNN